MSLALKLALSPLLAWQAVRTRQRIPKLPEAEGQRRGRVGQGPLLRLVVAGDSSAAGVGVALQSQALAAPLARMLAERLGCSVQWQLLARSGLNTAQILDLLRMSCVRADVVVLVSGVNDVVEQVSSARAVRTREALAAWLQHHAGAQHVAFLPLPPVRGFHGLPQPLRWIAGSDAQRHNQALKDWVDTAGDQVSLVDLDLPVNRGMLASDGFHPGEKAYRYITRAVAFHLGGIPVVARMTTDKAGSEARDADTAPGVALR
jgi:lysophospholipase L1-like esterase